MYVQCIAISDPTKVLEDINYMYIQGELFTVHVHHLFIAHNCKRDVHIHMYMYHLT